MIVNGVDTSCDDTALGFYSSGGDNDTIYEVIKNTDSKWLQTEPPAIYLVDTWFYDHTDYRGARIYTPQGSLFTLINIDFELTKIENIKYNVSNDGMVLEEVKPTYEQLEGYLKQLQKDYDKLAQQIRQTDLYKNVVQDISKVTEYTGNELDSLTLQQIIFRLELKETQ